ncbi:MAG: tetratricopeptide repeat protein [Planctomycetes bacterium]|nr:tetratricopeptide repeat protein [Planctomycetota bacterium]MCB9868300.1 tetratricopeptide repeat protein [Planctomycetota bacterium]
MKARRNLLVLSLPLLGCCATGPTPVAKSGTPATAESKEVAAPGPAQQGTAAAQDQGAPTSSGPQPAPKWVKQVQQSDAYQKQVAENYLIAATDVEPRVREDEREQYIQAQDLLGAAKPDYDKVLQVVSAACAGQSASPQFHFLKGSILVIQNKRSEAITAFEKAVKDAPNFRRAWTALAQAHFVAAQEKPTTEHFRGAANAFVKSIELGERKGAVYGLLGVCHSRLNNHLAAEGAFRNAAMLDPEHGREWKMGLADSFQKQGRLAESVAVLDSLIAEQPNKIEMWMAQAEVLVKMNQLQRAVQNLEMVDRLGGASPKHLDNLGALYANLGMHDLAVDAYSRAIARKPSADQSGHIQAARVLMSVDARAAAGKLIEFIEASCSTGLPEKSKLELLHAKARLAALNGADDEQAKALQKILEVQPLDGAALLSLGRYFARKGKKVEAITYFQRAAGLPEFEADAKVRHAEVLVSERNYAEAIPLLRRAQEIQDREHVKKYLESVERFAKTKAK